MLTTVLFHPLGPALILALGGLLLRFADAMRRPASRGYPVSRSLWPSLLVALSCIGAAFILLVLLRLGMGRSSIGWTWQPLTVAGGALEWRLDGWGWLATLLLLLLALASVVLEAVELRDPDGRPRQHPARTLWLAAAAASFVSSGNLLTLATCWVLLDLALAFRLRADEFAEPAGRTWSALSLAGLVLLLLLAMQGEGNIRSPLAAGTPGQLELILLWVAGLIRTGVYPLHGWLTGPGRAAASERIALHAMAPTTGLWLLAQAARVGGPGWLYRPPWIALGTLALLGTALAAWTAEGRPVRWRWIAANRAGMMLLAACVAEVVAPAALAWVMVTFALGSILLPVGQAGGPRWVWRLPVWLAALALWGLPGTTGFLARSALVLLTDLPAALPLFLLLGVAESLLVAALWRLTVSEAPADGAAPGVATRGFWPAWFTGLGLGLTAGLLAVLLLYWGLFPERLAALVDLPPDTSFPSFAWALVHARRSAWLGLAVSGMVGVILGRVYPRLFAAVRGWQRLTHDVVSLEWLYRAVAGGTGLIGTGLQYFATLGEGEGYVGWLALGMLILWLLLRG